MPIVSGNYESPTWVNDQAPKLNASEMNAITETVEASQVLTGSGAPTTSTAGVVGQKYVDTSTTPPTLYLCTGTSGGYTWWDFVSELDNKANIGGSYETLTAGQAEQLISSVMTVDKAPYLFRTTGGSADVGDRSYPVLTGGTVAWNQLAPLTKASWTVGGQSTLTITDRAFVLASDSNSAAAKNFYKAVPNGRVILLTASSKTHTNDTYPGYLAVKNGTTSISTSAAADHPYVLVKTPASGSIYAGLWMQTSTPSGDSVTVTELMIFDLTLMFGATVADRIAALETAEAGSGLAWIKSYGFFRRDYYAYNAGTLMSVCTSQHKTVGFNAFDPATGTAQLVGGHQYQISGTYDAIAYADINGNAESLTPDADGYFTPAADGTLTVTGGNSTTTCVHLVWDGERDGEWEAYVEHDYPLDASLTLRGIPGLDSSNNLIYTGDTYEPDGTVTRKYALEQVTSAYLSNLTVDTQIGYISSTTAFGGAPAVWVRNLFLDAAASRRVGGIGARCNAFPVTFNNSSFHNSQNRCAFQVNGTTVYSVDTFIAAVQALENNGGGLYVLYELATPTTTSATPYTSPQVVDDFGTEEYTDALYAAGTRDVEVPVGHTTKYPPNLRAKLEMAPNSPSGDGDYIVRQTGGINTYAQLVIPEELPPMPLEDGTYALQLTVTDGEATLSWVAQE